MSNRKLIQNAIKTHDGFIIASMHTHDYVTQGDEIYIKCKDEWTLCKKFLEIWNREMPDVISGWNVKFFDIPYIVNRFRKIIGEDETKKLSPWNYISERKAVVNKRELVAYTFEGVSTLDYIELYRWYAPGGKSQESYRLDAIAEVELGKNKLSYDEHMKLYMDSMPPSIIVKFMYKHFHYYIIFGEDCYNKDTNYFLD